MKKLWIFIFLSFMLGISAHSQNWLTNFEKAKQKSANTGNNILLVFSGSDWCVPCMKLEKEIWEKKTFQNYADTNLVLLRADFPRRSKNRLSEKQRKHNEKLAEKYNENGIFPMVILLDSTGNVLGSTGYKGISPEKYIELLESFES